MVSDTSGLSNADAEGVPLEEDPARFESGAKGDAGAERDAQAAEPDEDEPGQQDDAQQATEGEDGAEAPPADFDPAQSPSNPEMVRDIDQPD